jgi:hypothetical protein
MRCHRAARGAAYLRLPSYWQDSLTEYNRLRNESHEEPCISERRGLRGVESDDSLSAKLKNVPACEVDKYKTASGIDQNVSESLEVEATGKAGNGDYACIVDTYEPVSAGLVRYVDVT